jgi:hypothetical protein
MKKIVLNLIFVVTAILLVNCNFDKKHERIARLDSLQVMLDNTQKMLFNDVNYDSVMSFYNKLKINQEIIGPHIKKMNEKEKSDFFQLLSTEKQFKSFIGNYDGYKNELDYSKNQIDMLRKDVEEGNLSKEQFNEYYSSENKAIVSLFHSVKMEVYKTGKNIEKYKLFEPKVLSLVNQYNEKKK